VIIPVKVLDEKDDILDLHKVIYRSYEPQIIGINSVVATKLYIIPVEKIGDTVLLTGMWSGCEMSVADA
jgi:hypothetical protein